MEQRNIDIPIVDTHVHLWDPGQLTYPWLEEVPQIKKPFLIEDYQRATQDFRIEKMVFVQCECLPAQCLEEVQLVMEQAAKDGRIQGIVAYAPLEQGRRVEELLQAYSRNSLIKGVRRMYDEEPALCYSSDFLDALNVLPRYNLSFDISIKPHALPATIRMIGECPDTLFILDHLGKPDIRNGGLEAFQKQIDQVASHPNVVAKLSGLITEANWNSWTVDELRPYVQHALTAFGGDRLMFGGDWPVVLLSGTYAAWLKALKECLSSLDQVLLEKIFYKNAENIYKLQLTA